MARIIFNAATRIWGAVSDWTELLWDVAIDWLWPPDYGQQREEIPQRINGKRIYVASRTRHAYRWREARAYGYPVCSTWIDEAGEGESPCLSDLWDRCVLEASTADALVVYRERGEVLKGAYVEVGAALSSGVPVYAVGCSDVTFINHPLVRQVPTLELAMAAALAHSPGVGQRLRGIARQSIHEGTSEEAWA